MDATETIQKYLNYLKEERLFKKKSWEEYLAALRKLSSEINILTVKNHREVKNAILSLKQKYNWGGATTKKNSKCIKYFYAWCCREEILPYNPYPFDDFKKPRQDEAKFVTESEYKLVLREQILDQQDRLMIMTFWDGGMRRVELSTIDQNEVDLKSNMLHIPRQKSKGRYSDRWIPFSLATAAALKKQKEWLNAHGVLDAMFVNYDFKRITPSRINERFKRITLIKENGECCRLTPKMLRHSFGIRMMKKFNVPQVVVMNWLGHADPGMTNHYSHVTQEDSKFFYEKHVVSLYK